jgi:predicted glycoside hydrolase/deacetylase ChbG (UPF0249 family)
MPKNLILNADDFGWDEDATNGILNLIENNKIHNTTVLANHVQSADLLKLKKFQQNISIGLHTCINAGKSVHTSPSSLTDDQCNFFSSKNLFIKSLRKEIEYTDVLHEIKMQYNFLREHNIIITHADSHQHIHQYPVLSGMITQALSETGITKVRNCMPASIYDTRRVVVAAFCCLTKKNIIKFKHPDILITDFTNTHLSFEKCIPQILKKIAASSHQTIEWMCHPAIQDRPGSYLQRKAEYDFLKHADWQELLNMHSIKLSQYKDL